MDLSFGDAGPVPQPPLKPLDVATYEQALTDHYHATVQDLVNTMNTLPAGFERRNQELHRTFAQFEQEALAVATRLRKQATQRHLQNPAPTVWAEKYRRMVATDVAR